MKFPSDGNIYKGITAVGTRQDGTEKLIYGNISVYCPHSNLIRLDVIEGAFDVHCFGNNLKEIILPDSVECLRCDKELFDYDACNVRIVDIIYE